MKAMSGIPDFESAIKAGNVDAVQRQIEKVPALAGQPTSMGVTTVLLALYYGHAEVAAMLAAARTIDGFEAAALGDTTSLRVALKGNADYVNGTSADGFTMLGYAAYFGNAEAVEALLESGADPNQTSDNALGVAPLHSALSADHRAVAKLLIAHGANVNLAGSEGWTPLHYAAHNGDMDSVKMLLEKGAKREAMAGGKTPAQMAVDAGHPNVARALA